ncbi:MAG: IclR family transcriptional regulator [Solirubrobacterales bacterium]|nr:IclR family transcriptional regulator [Solirubrobacterales bacterium]
MLELFASASAEFSQTEISEALGLPMPTVHRLVALLTERGWLDRDPASRRLRLGIQMVHLVPALMGGMRLSELTRPRLIRLASELQETVNLAILEGAEIVYMLSESADRLLTSRATVGMRLPAHCTALGKCLLAALPQDVAQVALGDEPYERRTERTLTTWTSLAEDLDAIRKAGVSISEEEYEVGLVSVAVPVRWLHGPGTGAINVSLPATRASAEFRDRLTERLLETAGEIGVPNARR